MLGRPWGWGGAGHVKDGRTRDDGSMSSPSIPLTGLLSDGGVWTPVTDSESGAIVLRHVSKDRFAKVVSLGDARTLEAERDRIEWLSGTGIPRPAVLDCCSTEHGACLSR